MILKVEMTTGATIHTTNGLKMTVTRRTQLQAPIIPTLEGISVVESESTASISIVNS